MHNILVKFLVFFFPCAHQVILHQVIQFQIFINTPNLESHVRQHIVTEVFVDNLQNIHGSPILKSYCVYMYLNVSTNLICAIRHPNFIYSVRING